LLLGIPTTGSCFFLQDLHRKSFNLEEPGVCTILVVPLGYPRDSLFLHTAITQKTSGCMKPTVLCFQVSMPETNFIWW
jgi:hypothetical protein